METFNSYLNAINQAVRNLDSNCIEAIQHVRKSLLQGRTVFTCGNGGSAATAMHYSVDWSKGLLQASGKPCKSINLNSNMGLITAIANDLSYEEVFSHQLSTLCSKRDVLVVVSGSGLSPNIIQALNMANREGLTSVGVIGFDGGKILESLDFKFHINYNDMQIFEDISSIFGHAVLRNELL